MLIRDFMTKPVTVVDEEMTLEAIAVLMLDKNIGCVPVVDKNGRLCGVITESDFAAKEKGIPFSTFRAPQLFGRWISQEGIDRIYEAARSMKAREIMSRSVATVTEDDTIDAAIALMLKHDVNRIPVVRDFVPVGMVSRHDLLKMMLRRLRTEETRAGGE